MEFTTKNMIAASAACSVFGLLLIYVASLAIEPSEIQIQEISFDHVGTSVTTSGKVTYVNQHPAGHIFLTLTDGVGTIEVPIFSAVANDIRNNDDMDIPRKGSTIRVTGTVGEYKGNLQVIPAKASDVSRGE